MFAQTEDIDSSSLAAWLEPEEGQNGQRRETHSLAMVAIEKLSIFDSPRIEGESQEHLEALMAIQDKLPPIIVHKSTMRVIDGIHRLRAAKARGERHILARFFEGDEADAFVLAVQSNIAHGLPLSLADRRAAAVRIISSHRHWSDRMIASVTGLAARTVADIRRGSGDLYQADFRVGQDGRVRPINKAAGRMLACQLMTDNPHLSLRQVAQAAGVSPETVRDVRKRLQEGRNPVPERAMRKISEESGSQKNTRIRLDDIADKIIDAQMPTERVAATVQRLKADPTLRYTETGRCLLRLLHLHLIEAAGWQKICANIPPHCSIIVANLARQCAYMWLQLSEELERGSTQSA